MNIMLALLTGTPLKPITELQMRVLKKRKAFQNF